MTFLCKGSVLVNQLKERIVLLKSFNFIKRFLKEYNLVEKLVKILKSKKTKDLS